MPDPHDIDDQRLEEIVAYLDGELSPDASARVERRLASDESYRQQLQGIERAWKALDELPLTTVDDRFSRTTMEMAVQAAQAELQQRTDALPVVRRRLRLSTILAAVAASALAFLVVRLVWRQPDRLLLADLPVVENVDVYSQFQEIEFLRALRRELAGELDELAAQSSDLDDRVAQFQRIANVDVRRSWLSGLDDVERTNLRAKYYRFRELPPEEQQRLRELHQAIVAAPDADELQRTMLAYHAWLSGVPPARQFELRDTADVNQRVGKVKQWTERMREDALLTLTEEELRKFAASVHKSMDESRRQAGERDRDGRGPGRNGQGQRRGPYMAAWQFATENAERLEAAVQEALPERVRERFSSMQPREKFQQFATWMRQAEALDRGQISQQELERFFSEELDVKTREYLLSLPAEQMQQALEWQYRRQTGIGFDGPRWRDRDGPDGRGRDDRDDWRGPPEGRGEGRPRGPGDGRGPGPGLGPPDGFLPRGFGSPGGPRHLGDAPPDGHPPEVGSFRPAPPTGEAPPEPPAASAAPQPVGGTP